MPIVLISWKDGRKTRRQVRGTGTGSRQDDAYLARCAGIAVRRVRRALFVGCQHVGDALLIFIQLIVDLQHLAAGISENMSNALLDEGLDNDL